ncbi:MAG TPA: 2OG-Fe(II) oxygenase [Aestuariivirga sp.]|nr:2OG-Fe(II) oxygenase [Aestuariivirga sp.]
MSYLEMCDTRLGLFDAGETEKKGLELNTQYNSAQPYPHIEIDDFFPPEILEMCLKLFPKALDKEGMTFDRPQERLKSSFNPDYLESPLRTLFYSLNSKPFIRFLENMTGIKGLIPDPYFMGAGFHEIKNGGHLSVHADFNHHKPMDLERRINVLIYLNKDWKEEYGGQLELWDNDMTACQKSVVPLFNRCVVFNTTSTSNHGNPNIVNHPQGIPRRSIALYYYTSTWSGEKRDHTTQFRSRPGSADRTDYQVKSDETLRDLLPPIVYRNIKKIGNRLRHEK